MSDRNLETVRGIYERWGQGDFSAGVDLYDPFFLFILGPGFPDEGAYLGPDEVAKYMRGFLEAWTPLTIEAEELVPIGDSVLASVVQRGVGESSGLPTELRYTHVWTFRGSQAIRLEGFRDHADALAAVGLPE